MRRIVACIVIGMLALTGCGKDKPHRGTSIEALRRQKKLKDVSREQKTIVVPHRTVGPGGGAEPSEGRPQPVMPPMAPQ